MKNFIITGIILSVLLISFASYGQNFKGDSNLIHRPAAKNFHFSKEKENKLHVINLHYQKSIDSLIKDHTIAPNERYKAIITLNTQKDKDITQLLGIEQAELLRRYINNAQSYKRVRYQIAEVTKKRVQTIKQ